MSSSLGDSWLASWGTSWEVTSTIDSGLKYWTGSAWEIKPLKRWNGGSWVSSTISRYTGTSWV